MLISHKSTLRTGGELAWYHDSSVIAITNYREVRPRHSCQCYAKSSQRGSTPYSQRPPVDLSLTRVVS